MATHLYQNGQYKTSISTFNNIMDIKQPEMSPLKNCTAAISGYLHTFPWITIPCDIQYQASYVCQSVKATTPHQSMGESLIFNNTCEDGWFMFDGTNTCFSFTGTIGQLSYYEAEDVCRAQHASLVTVDVTDRNFEIDKTTKFSTIVDGVLNEYKLSLHKQYYYNYMFGKPLARESPRSYLPDILLRMTLPHIPIFFVKYNNKCSVVEMSFYSLAVSTEPESSMTRGWGVKCRYCSELVEVDAVICEKHSNPSDDGCQPNHFKCSDGTCILIIYKCDFIDDCFDLSDEENCENNISSKPDNNVVILPCSLVGLCTYHTTFVLPIKDICDGIYSNETIHTEYDVCYKYTLKHINLSSLMTNDMIGIEMIVAPNEDSLSNMSILQQEKEKCTGNALNADYVRSNKSLSYEVSEQFKSLNKICKITVYNNNLLLSIDRKRVCHHIICPGMFKCHKHYCIHISSVCDGQYDCNKGDDETMCPMSSCPGFLKCRGENRCVGREEICDKHINCLNSMDDEIDCHACPLNCVCEGYSASCYLNNSLIILYKSDIDHIKGIMLRGIQNKLYLHHLKFHGLVYLNASSCSIEHIVLLRKMTLVKSFIIVVDLHRNNLEVINFLQASIFGNIIYLDISFNYLYFINIGKRVKLKSLAMLALNGNPLRTIIVNLFELKSKLLFIDMQYIWDYSDLSVDLPLNMYGQIQVKVSEYIICCILSENVKCMSQTDKHICFGVFENNILKICFYCISIVAICMAVCQLAIQIVHFPLAVRNKNSKKKYYFLVLFNHSSAVILSTLYIVGLMIANIINVNMFFWRKSLLCMILNITLFLSLEAIMTFKAILIITLACQVMYPFKHQCLWFRWIGLLAVGMWLFFVSVYFVKLFDPQLYSQIHTLDSLCSIGMCDIRNAVYLLLCITCFIDFISVLLCIIIFIKTLITLVKYKEKTSKLRSNQNHSANNLSLLFKLSVPITAELPFRLCLLILLVSAFKYTPNVDFCKYIFLFALPGSIVLSSVLFAYRKYN